MEMKEVKSSSITHVGYEPETKTLAVKFASGSVYHYPNVTQQEHEEFVNAPSLGRHFAQNIRSRKSLRA